LLIQVEGEKVDVDVDVGDKENISVYIHFDCLKEFE
jgi:hypothetical protein